MRSLPVKSFQNLSLLQNLYRLKALGFEYIDHFDFNEKSDFEQPHTLEELTKSIHSCHMCDLSKSRTQSMGGFGNKHAELFFLDYSVSQIQDSSNSYYSGRSGEILKNMIEKVLALRVEDVFFTHAVKCKTLHTQKPSDSEFDSCKGYLFSQLELIKPKIVVTLGADAYSHLTNDHDNFENVRGHVIDFKSYKLVPIYHPQHLLRNPALKKIAMQDLKTIQALF